MLCSVSHYFHPVPSQISAKYKKKEEKWVRIIIIKVIMLTVDTKHFLPLVSLIHDTLIQEIHDTHLILVKSFW